MSPYFLLLIPVAIVAAYAIGVVFWTLLGQLRFLAFHHGEENPPSALGVAGWTRFYARTLRGAFLLLWWFFRAAFRDGLRGHPSADKKRPVLCVHGLFVNSTCMWGIRRHLEDQGRPTRAVFMGLPYPTPAVYAAPLTAVLREMKDQFPTEGFDIVAHSMGGIMLRQVLQENPGLDRAIRHIVTLGTPHHGTAFLPWMRQGPVYQMLRYRSDYLLHLPDFRAVAPHAAVTTIGTEHDLMVYPVETSHLEGAEWLTLSRVSHLGLTTEPAVMRLVAETLDKSTDQPTGSESTD